MEGTATAPVCIVVGCEELSALSSTARCQFFTLTTYYCASCYQRLLDGEDLQIEAGRIIVERSDRKT